MKIALDDGTRLFLDVEGAQWVHRDGAFVQRPTILLLHGGPGPDHRRGKVWAGALADSAQIVYLDQRGHGLSDLGAPGTHTLARWADDAAELIAKLGLERPIVLGVSFGGFVAQTLAIRHPGLLGGLILLSTAAHNDLDRIEAAMRREGGDEPAAVARAFYAGPRTEATGATYARVCMPLYATHRATAPIDDGPWNVALTASFTDPATGEFRHDDRRAALRAVAVPTLILAGAHDPVTPIEAARELADCFAPGVATLHVYPQASHAVPTDAPESLDDIRAFLGAVPR